MTEFADQERSIAEAVDCNIPPGDERRGDANTAPSDPSSPAKINIIKCKDRCNMSNKTLFKGKNSTVLHCAQQHKSSSSSSSCLLTGSRPKTNNSKKAATTKVRL